MFWLLCQVIRREVEKQSDFNGGGLLREEEGAGKGGRVADSATKRVVAAGAVDDDLYKVPRPLMYQKPRKVLTTMVSSRNVDAFCNS
jgi:hypothetical protein